jgi:hypothetical protein
VRYREVAELAGQRFNRISRAQLEELGYTSSAVEHALRTHRLVAVEPGVYALPPLLDDRWGAWTGATLTEPGTVLALWSAGLAFGILGRERALVSVMRPGMAGPRRHGGIVVYYRPLPESELGTLRGIPITSPERTLLDLAQYLSVRELARALREAVRLGLTTLEGVMAFLLLNRRRRGTRKLLRVCARYAGLPLERARSGAEVRALHVLRDAKREIPLLNVKVAGIEADLVWRRQRLIIEVDGGPFHLDAGEDVRKEAAWRAAGYKVLRISSDDVYDRPERLVAIAPL